MKIRRITLQRDLDRRMKMTKHKLSEPTKYEMPMIDEKPWKQLIKHVERLDDTVTRLTLEMAKVRKQLKHHEKEIVR